MKNWLLFVFSVLLLSSCASFKVPEMKGGESFNVDKISSEEVKLTLGANILNENWFGLKIKPSQLDLYVEDNLIGKVSLDKKVKLKRKRETAIEAPVTVILDEGAYMKMLRYVGKGDVKVRIKGDAKGGIFIFSKKFYVDETKSISTGKLGL